MHKGLFALLTAAVTFLSFGCVGTQYPTGDPRVHLEPSAVHAIQIQQVSLSSTQSETMELQVFVRSRRTHYQQLEYRTTWFRANGTPLSTALSKWNRMGLNPDEVAAITARAPSAEAADFRIQFRQSPQQ
ncbi:MAG: YcfL family protein [Victivallales bacterium]|nr:YcfL family protein [Victivallales bacterium]